MTRKTRCRQSRIHTALQFGFCEICHQPYTSFEEHIQSKKHLKLVGDDPHFISLNGYDSLLALDNIETIDANDKSLKRRSPLSRRTRMMRPNKEQETIGHHKLRTRKNVNYQMSPLDEEDERHDPVKEYRELRSSTRLLAKLVENDEVWNSGRPKRSCIRQKRISADERLVVDNKTYYKVDVLPTKLRSSGTTIRNNLLSSNDSKDDDKFGVKLKKKRNSELSQLNSEAENFLFPKKSETDDGYNTISNDNETVLESKDDKKSKNVMENGEGMEPKAKKRRRTHAEAFIMDNQKYYKFETPGSRLRYQGSYLTSVPLNKSGKVNGDCTKNENKEKNGFKLNMDNYSFSFEKVPKNDSWYQTFKRQDEGREHYLFLEDKYYFNTLLLPYQMDQPPPLDPRECLRQYNYLQKCIVESFHQQSSSSCCDTPEPTSIVPSTNSSACLSDAVHDDDSKMSVPTTETSSSRSCCSDDKPLSKRRSKRPKTHHIDEISTFTRHPRKSPRQHASTLAILSSLLHQRKRRLRTGDAKLTPIIEETSDGRTSQKTDYLALAKSIEDELRTACFQTEDDEIEVDGDGIDFSTSKISMSDVMECYENGRLLTDCATINVGGCGGVRRLLTGKKPGRKKKKNRTGWPNRNRRTATLKAVKTGVPEVEVHDESTGGDSLSEEDRRPATATVEPEEVTTSADEKTGASAAVVRSFLQPYVRVQKLDNERLAGVAHSGETEIKRGIRKQRRMPASPKSPRMLRRPRGRWYRER